MEIDTISLQCFVAVAESKSFTKASERVSRSQSAVSQQIVKLENLSGKQLFIRGKTILMTEDGEVFLNYARQILKLHNEVIEQFKKPDLDGEVRFGIPEEFAHKFLQNVLTEFTQAHSRISLHIDCDLTLNLYDKFKKDDLDLIVVKTKEPDNFPNSLELAAENLMWFGDSHLVKKDSPIPLILSPAPCVYRKSALNALDKAGIKWQVAFSSHSYASRIAALKAGIGLSIMPFSMQSSQIRPIKLGLLPELERSYILLLKSVADNAAINSLEDFIIKNLSYKNG